MRDIVLCVHTFESFFGIISIIHTIYLACQFHYLTIHPIALCIRDFEIHSQQLDIASRYERNKCVYILLIAPQEQILVEFE